MNKLKKLLNDTRFRVAMLVTLLVTLVLAGLLGLMADANREASLRKSPTAKMFEKEPEQWLTRPAELIEFQNALDTRQLASVGIREGLVLFTLKDGSKHSTLVPGCTVLSCNGTVLDKLPELSSKDGFSLARVDVDPRSSSRRTLDALGAMVAPAFSLALLCLVGYLVFTMQGGGGDKKAGKLVEKPTTRFSDVIGAEEAKAGLKRVQAFIKDPSNYVDIGAKPPHGVLLEGPPGTGKTLLAKALAGESGANFIAIDGSYFTSMFYGLGVRKVRQVFELARKSAPCVLFIDEFDGIGKRTSGKEASGGETEQNRIINRVLVEMDGFQSRENVVVVGATNHVGNIDPAMRRPGRFDRVIRLMLPTLPDRKALFERYLRDVKTEGDINAETLARMTQGMSPADIANTANEAASKAAEAGDAAVTNEHLLRAVETFQLGGEVSANKQLITPETRERVAVHEAGHALMAHVLKTGSVDRVSIEPRGEALGVTFVSRFSEEPLFQQNELTSRLSMMLGGREAELLVKGNVSSGAADDLKRATELAVSMVGNLGFSSTFGLLSVAGVPQNLVGPDIQAGILAEARRMLEDAQALCVKTMTEHRAALDALTQLLLAQETVSGEPLQKALSAR